jgi:hypothetical protein
MEGWPAFGVAWSCGHGNGEGRFMVCWDLFVGEGEVDD